MAYNKISSFPVAETVLPGDTVAGLQGGQNVNFPVEVLAGAGLTTAEVNTLITDATAPLIARIAVLEGGLPAAQTLVLVTTGGSSLVLTGNPANPSFVLN